MESFGETMALFRINWECEIVRNEYSLYKFKHQQIGTFGTFHLTHPERIIKATNEIAYKMVSLIYEAILQHRNIAIVPDDESRLEIESIGEYDVVTVDQLLQRFPRTLEEKQNRILQNMYRLQPIPGSAIEHFKFDSDLNFSANQAEFGFLLDLMVLKNLIKVNISWNSGRQNFRASLPLIIEEQGWAYLEELQKSENSKQVFVAMWFHESMNPAFNAIQSAVEDLDGGLTAFRIDHKEHNNEISGEILYEIRRSKVLVADVTGQRQGVYFEAGYALALGMPVIWCCREDEIGKVHFDTRQYSHVVWKDEVDLRNKLKSRIKGTIL